MGGWKVSVLDLVWDLGQHFGCICTNCKHTMGDHKSEPFLTSTPLFSLLNIVIVLRACGIPETVTKKGIQPCAFLPNAWVEIFGEVNNHQHGLLCTSESHCCEIQWWCRVTEIYIPWKYISSILQRKINCKLSNETQWITVRFLWPLSRTMSWVTSDRPQNELCISFYANDSRNAVTTHITIDCDWFPASFNIFSPFFPANGWLWRKNSTRGTDSGSTKGMPTFVSVNSINKFSWSELKFISWLVECRGLGTTVVVIVSCHSHAEMWRIFRLDEAISSESPILWFWQEIHKVSEKLGSCLLPYGVKKTTTH